MTTTWQHQFVTTNNVRLHYVTQGSGDLVILLHGLPEFWYSWRYQIPALARQFTVVVPDLRGCNDSEKPNEGYDLDTIVADIRGLITSLGFRKAHIVGHDWGGTVAWYFAQKLPEMLDRLAVLNAPHPQSFLAEMGQNWDQLQRSWYLFALQVPSVPEWILRFNARAWMQNLLREQSVRKAAFSSEDTQLYQAAIEKPGALTALIQYYRHWLSPSLLWQTWVNVPDRIQVPTLVLWGEDDFLLSKTLTNKLDQLIQAPFQLKFIARCGHWIQQEAPQTVNRELLQFLSEKS